MKLLSLQSTSISRGDVGTLGDRGCHSTDGRVSAEVCDYCEAKLYFDDHDNNVVAQYIAVDVGYRIVIVDCDHNTPAWYQYVAGLSGAYGRHGISVDRDVMMRDREKSRCLTALAVSDEGIIDGGVRMEGPFQAATAIPGLRDLDDGSKNYVETVRRYQEMFRNDQLVGEAKGTWSNAKGIGKALARALIHMQWLKGIHNLAAFSALHSLKMYKDHGWDNEIHFSGIQPFPFPSGKYKTFPLLLSQDNHKYLGPSTLQLVRAEQRFLQPVKAILSPTQPSSEDWQEWCPEILLDNEHRVEQLRRDGRTKMIDHYADQHQELNDKILPRVENDLILNEPPRWIHMAWRNTAVRVLGPLGYKMLRTDRNRHKMTTEEMNSLGKRSVGVVGMSVGHSSALALAQEGLCGHMKIADFDRLELTNMNRIPTSIVELGALKTHLTARRIAEIDPYLPVELYDGGVSEANVGNFMSGLDVVVEECDSLDVKVLVRKEAAAQRVPVIMETSDRGLLDVERFDLEPNRPLFHGLAGHSIDPSKLKGLSTEDKGPFVMDILESDKLSTRFLASMIEIDQSINNWPQLARDVMMGSSLVATAVHKLFSDPTSVSSGRSRIDLSSSVTNLQDPLQQETDAEAKSEPYAVREPLSADVHIIDSMYIGAGLAPSGGNMQPWTFSHTDDSFSVTATPQRNVGLDIGYRGTAVACGTALANAAAVAASHSDGDGIEIQFSKYANQANTLVQDALDRDRYLPIGSVHLGEPIDDARWAGLGDWVTQRVTNRNTGPPIPLSSTHIEALRGSVESNGANFHHISVNDPNYMDFVQIWAEADRIRLLNKRLHQEMFSEVKWRGENAEEGIDIDALELTPKGRRVIKALSRESVLAELAEWDLGNALRKDTVEKFEESSGLIAVSVKGSDFLDYVRGGIALEHMWLTAAKLGVGVQPWVPVFAYAHSEKELAKVIGPESASKLYPMGREALSMLGMTPSDNLVLPLRVHTGPPPSTISLRRPVESRATE